MIAVVLGGSGFIGSMLVDRLLAQGVRVRLFDREIWRSPHHLLECRTGDFSTHEDFSTLLEGGDVVYHLISTTLPNTSVGNVLEDVQGNLIPTLRLLDQMGKAGVLRIVFPSSGGTVYGEAQYLPIDEKHRTDPIVPYGATKLAIEKYLAVYAHARQLRSICLRIANPYGPGFKRGSPQGAIGAFLLRAMGGQTIDLWGDGDVQRDYLYIDDLVDALTAVLDYKGSETVFNISTGVGTNLLEVLDLVQAAVGRPLEIRRHEGRAFDVKVNILSSALARQEFGWSPSTDLATGVQKTLQWLKAQR